MNAKHGLYGKNCFVYYVTTYNQRLYLLV